MSIPLRFLLAVACLAVSSVSVLADPPKGPRWKLVWGDEFDGKEVDDKKWEKVGDGKRRDAYWLKSAAFLDGKGKLIVRSSRREDGSFACGGLRSRGRFLHSFGYYEIRCEVPDEVGTWAAFWLYAPCVGQVGEAGRDGSEIDIFEAVWRDQDLVNIAVHWDGYGKEHRSWGEKVKTPGVNEGFHTFGLWWKPDEYIFYYDGKEVRRSKAGGVCQVPLYVKVTTEIGKWAGDIREAELPDDFVVDYVRVYDVVEAEEKGKTQEAEESGKPSKKGEEDSAETKRDRTGSEKES
ncbi:MAG: glycoside hydrolase family 16 protein [Planctomycetes bacterium]|nr:glycoside hydrolase family 16 protein [Planctomycetota bacterium]